MKKSQSHAGQTKFYKRNDKTQTTIAKKKTRNTQQMTE